ncbi:MAG: hypothetical protein ACMUIE_01270 [Thermoplasmatota archaeon]
MKERKHKKKFIRSIIIVSIVVLLITIITISINLHRERGGKEASMDVTGTETDDDGIESNDDEFPRDPNECTDTDGDGVEDCSDDYPNDPDSYKDGDPIWMLDGYFYPYVSQDVWVEISEIHGRIDYFSWNLTTSEPLDIHVMNPDQQSHFADQDIGPIGRFEIDMVGTWQIVFAYTRCIPPWDICPRWNTKGGTV